MEADLFLAVKNTTRFVELTDLMAEEFILLPFMVKREMWTLDDRKFSQVFIS